MCVLLNIQIKKTTHILYPFLGIFFLKIESRMIHPNSDNSILRNFCFHRVTIEYNY